MSEMLDKMREFIRQTWVPDFEYVINATDDIPWAPMEKKLSECRVAVISSGGFHLKSDPPFDVDNPCGDPTYRVIPSSATREQLGIAHTHYTHEYVDQDLNVAFPLAIFREMDQEGTIGGLAPNNYSFMGYIPVTEKLVNSTATEVAKRLAADEVDAVFIAPT